MSRFSRAALWSAGAAFAGGLIYSFIEPHRLQVRRFDVAMQNLPREADGLRIAQLSDLHVSAITGAGVARRAVELCNAEKPDAIVLTGDYISRRNSYSSFTFGEFWARDEMAYAAEMAAAVADLRAPEGVFAVPGNHDHWNGNCAAIMNLLRDNSATVLLNESTQLRGVLPLIGLDDLRAGRPDIKKACAGVSPDKAQVLLSHNPRIFARLAERNCLLITGHTHGGQVHLPLTNFRRRPRDMRASPWNQGWYRWKKAQMFVSVGVGSVHFPMRYHCPPEIVIYTLRRNS
jgi:predicted MPP superfamily phosphohydrolase